MQLVTFLVVLAIVAVLTVAVRGTLAAPLLLLPVVLLALAAFVTGLALVVSVLHAYYRDVGPILGAALLPWFFVSPIFFEPADIVHHAWARDVLTWAEPGGAVHHRRCATSSTPGLAERRRPSSTSWPPRAWPSRSASALFRRLSAELAVVV